jgi:sugar O-acyltransferase (sialic acid O-acetyltransferase NeuD family)
VELYGIVGAGGFGREVMPVAMEYLDSTIGSGNFEIVFVAEDTDGISSINGYRLISLAEFISHESEAKKFNIAISDYSVRERIAEVMADNNIASFQFFASNSICLDNNTIGEGAIFCPFTSVTSSATIGKFFHANLYSYVAHDCVIGDYVTFAPNVHCNGGVVVEDYAYIGTGAIIKQGTDDRPIVIGEGAIVGMGSIVNKSVLPYTIVAGNPAKKIGMAR